MDSTGLHAFELYARSLDGSGPLVLENASAHIRRVFEITGIDRNPNIELRSDDDHG
jgi:anti-anti-sigma regulatory factor